jgi:hypothetical protein
MWWLLQSLLRLGAGQAGSKIGYRIGAD